MFLDRILRKPHPGSDFPLGQSTDTAQNECLAGLPRHARDYFGKLAQVIMRNGTLFGSGCIVGPVDLPEIFDCKDGHNPRSADVTNHQRMGYLKKVGTRIQDVVYAFAFGQQRIAFLHDVIDVECCWRPSAGQPAPECWLMRQDVNHEPARSFDIIQSGIHLTLYCRSIRQPRFPNIRQPGKCRAMLFAAYDGYVAVSQGATV
jgi:hypothetical protein